MARWLNAFTATELADALHVHPDVGAKFVKALLWQGICEDTGIVLETASGPEPLIEIIPLPKTIYKRNKYPPVWLIAVMETGGFKLYNRRGEPVRQVDSAKKRQQMSQPGVRHRVRMRELAYQRMQEARKKAAEKAEKRRIAMSQGKRYEPDPDD